MLDAALLELDRGAHQPRPVRLDPVVDHLEAGALALAPAQAHQDGGGGEDLHAGEGAVVGGLGGQAIAVFAQEAVGEVAVGAHAQ